LGSRELATMAEPDYLNWLDLACLVLVSMEWAAYWSYFYWLVRMETSLREPLE